MTDDGTSQWHPFRYTPSMIAAVVFVVLFAITTLIHTIQVVRTRTWYFIPVIVGGLFEIIGFVARIFSRPNEYAILAPFVIQAVFILIPPTLFAASIYMILGRIMLMVDGERYSHVRQKHLTILFVTGDFITLNIQSNGASIQSQHSLTLQNLGKWIIIVGLVAQLLFFGLFLTVAAIFHYRLVIDRPVAKHVSFHWVRKCLMWMPLARGFTKFKQSRPPSSEYATHASVGNANDIYALPWRKHISVLYATSALIFIRSVFRVVEFTQGNEGYLLSTEVYLYVFDAALMFVVMVLFNFVHPSEITSIYQERIRNTGMFATGVELQGPTEGAIGSADDARLVARGLERA